MVSLSGVWSQFQLKLRECLADLVDFIEWRVGCDASGDGRHGNTTVEEKWLLAKEVLGDVAKGEDPAEDSDFKGRHPGKPDRPIHMTAKTLLPNRYCGIGPNRTTSERIRIIVLNKT
jgi:hypothetical protein